MCSGHKLRLVRDWLCDFARTRLNGNSPPGGSVRVQEYGLGPNVIDVYRVFVCSPLLQVITDSNVRFWARGLGRRCKLNASYWLGSVRRS